MYEELRKIARHSRERVGEWLQKYGQKLLLSLGVFAVIALAFEGGFLIGRDRRVEPLVIEKPAESCISTPAMVQGGGGSVLEVTKTAGASSVEAMPKDLAGASSSSATSRVSTAPTEKNENCAFVGSRNSDKYHLAKCTWAKRIKPENRVCFASTADAEAKGYKPGCVK